MQHLPIPPAAKTGSSTRAWTGSPALSTQLAAAFTALLLLMLLVVALSAWHLRAVQLAADRIAGEEWPRLLALQELATHAQGHGAAMASLLTASRSQREGIYPSLDAESAAMDRLTKDLKERITEPDALALVESLDAARHRYREVFAEVGVWIESGEPSQAAALFAASGQPALDQLMALAAELATAQQIAVAAWQVRAAERVSAAETQLLVVTLSALAAAAILAWRIGGGVARPMERLAETARRLETGDLQARVGLAGRAGPREVEGVGLALDAMAAALDERNAHIEAIAFWDPITKLPNRAGLMRRSSDRSGTEGDRCETDMPARHDTVVLFDVARLAAVNDVLGPSAGDALLHALAARLKAAAEVRGWTAAHLGAGTFAVMGTVDPTRAAADVDALRLDLLERLSSPVNCEDVSIDPQFHCGWSRQVQASGAVGDMARVLREAEEAVADAKRLRTDIRRFERIDPQRRRRQLVLLGSLRQAAAQGELQMWLQPKVVLAETGRLRCHGFEALVRWRHQEWGMVSPAEFVPFAEAAGMVGVITRCMVEQALHFLAQASVRSRGLQVSVNVSTADLMDDGFAEWLLERAHRLGAPLSSLTLEITEGRLMDDAERALPRMHALRDAGVRWSIDDFGTGYSSLAYLQRLPVAELKVDRSFVDHVDASPARIALLRSIVQLGHGLGLQVTAEGIERREEWLELQEAGCDLGQGWLFARPMPSDEAMHWLRGHTAPADVRSAMTAA